MNTTNPPPHPAELALVLALIGLEALWLLLRPVLAHAAALVLTLLRAKPQPQRSGAPALMDELAADCAPAPRPVANKKQRRPRRTRHIATEAPC
jgi:hypothetical protein